MELTKKGSKSVWPKSRQAVAGDHLPAAGLQDQVPGEFLSVARQPRVRQHQQNLRLLRSTVVLYFIVNGIDVNVRVFIRYGDADQVFCKSGSGRQ